MDSVKDIYGHITDRVQKLTSALYRVTEMLSDKEPIKWTLRDNAIAIHSSLMSIKFIKDRNSVLKETLAKSYQIIKSLELVSTGTGVSSLNFEILKREYFYLKNLLEGRKSDIVFEQSLLPEISALKNQKTDTKFLRKNKHSQSGGEIKNIPAKENEKNGTDIPETTLNQDMETGPVNPQIRKEKILDFLKGKEPKTVGEIGIIFNGEISGKAIQRDLFDLVKTGKISAMGDKRWRKYGIIWQSAEKP